MNSNIKEKLYNLVGANNEASNNLSDFITGEFLDYFVTNFSHLNFESVSIDATFLCFDISVPQLPQFFAEKEANLLGYNVEISAYSNSSGSLTIQFDFSGNESIPEMIDINGRFVLYPSDLLEFLSSNPQVNEQYFNNDWRKFGIRQAEYHITQIEKLIEYYRTKL